MHLSLTPVLLAVELGFLFALAWRLRRRRLAVSGSDGPGVGPVFVYFAWLTVYGVITSVLGAGGLYVSEAVLESLPGLWLQVVTIAAAVLPVAFSPGLRDGLRRIVDATPRHWFAYFHGLRITALGTAYQTMMGRFPAYFEYLVGIPDLVFGLSAFWIAGRVRRGELSDRGFMIWNLIGAFAIVPSAPILLQLGLPGPLQVFYGPPDARAVFEYPMSIAPMIGVPLFVLINLWVAWRLWERGQLKAAAPIAQEVGPAMMPRR